MSYSGPVKSMHYLLRHAVDIDALLANDAHAEVNHELIGDILSGAASFAEDVLAPINWDGDQNPCLLYTSPSPRDQRGSRMPSSA